MHEIGSPEWNAALAEGARIIGEQWSAEMQSVSDAITAAAKRAEACAESLNRFGLYPGVIALYALAEYPFGRNVRGLRIWTKRKGLLAGRMSRSAFARSIAKFGLNDPEKWSVVVATR